jgi:hypothetical protein
MSLLDSESESESNVKTIVFTEIKGNKKESVINNALMYVKREKKERIEVETWGLTETDLSFEKQLELLKAISLLKGTKDKYSQLLINHIKTKIHGYKHQDVLKKKYNETEFINLSYVIELLIESGLKCHYCACESYLLYEIVRETKQWSLDRINNDLGHNKGNLVMACLECNLKRRRINKDAFFMTRNLKIFREGIDI